MDFSQATIHALEAMGALLLAPLCFLAIMMVDGTHVSKLMSESEGRAVGRD